MKRILLIGGAGQLGTALREVAGGAADAPSHAELDVERDDLGERLDAGRYEAVVNCAAFHNVDACEREPERAFAVNAVAVERLAAACAKRGVVFVTISTDYVFDGDLGRAYHEDDQPSPRTVYGISKLAGERLVRRHGPRHLIVRTSGLFGTVGVSNKGYTLIDKVLAQAERGEPTRMVEDMTFSPSYAPHVARAILALLDAAAYGTHHVTNTGACSWYGFVRAAFNRAGHAEATLEPISYTSFGSPTPRPMHSPLENRTFARACIAPMPTWESALDEYLTNRRARRADGTRAPAPIR